MVVRMTLARKTIVSLGDTPYYHCVSRCVRRAFLCGFDSYSDQSYEHRKQWLEDKLHNTARAFAIKLCAYAVMSNHYHVVLHVRPDLVNSWSDREVAERWHKLFSGSLFSRKYLNNEKLLAAERQQLKIDISLWRKRLCDISWFMRIVNEAIARRANKEDDCTGRFWEGRFKSQALLDEQALLSCMAYVDLNPIRAVMATSLEESDDTSIKTRIKVIKASTPEKTSMERFIGGEQGLLGIPFSSIDYLELVDWSGRIIRQGKRGAIHHELPPILERLSIDKNAWTVLITQFENRFKQWVGTEHSVRKIYHDKHYQRVPATDNYLALLG